MPGGHHHHAPAGLDPPLQVADDAGGVAAVSLGRRRPQAERAPCVLQGGRRFRPPGACFARRQRIERRNGPPGQPQLVAVLADLLQRAERGGAEVDRRLSPGGGVDPARLQELLARPDQLHRPGADPLRLAHQQRRPVREQVGHQLHPVGEDGRERLHPLDGVAVGDPAEDLLQRRMPPGEQLRALAHLLRQRQLAARRRPQPALRDLQRPLVRRFEVADLLDGVAPELHPQRVLLGRREHVQDPAAHRDLAALLHQVDAVVPGVDQAADGAVQVGVLAGREPHRLQVGEPGDDRLQDGPDRRHDHVQRAALAVPAGLHGVRVGEAAQHREPLPDRVRPRGQLLVRQRLPRREVRDPRRVEQARQGGGQVLGLPAGRGHREHGAAAARPQGAAQRRGEHRPQRGRRHDLLVRARPFEGPRQPGIGARKVNKSRKRHFRPHNRRKTPWQGSPKPRNPTGPRYRVPGYATRPFPRMRK
ncbi:Uncharacterised protein [Mycobacterium tuberculosis]|nr:Uncharacterised protein [Mycobacterium tuberculosis]